MRDPIQNFHNYCWSYN